MSSLLCLGFPLPLFLRVWGLDYTTDSRSDFEGRLEGSSVSFLSLSQDVVLQCLLVPGTSDPRLFLECKTAESKEGPFTPLFMT